MASSSSSIRLRTCSPLPNDMLMEIFIYLPLSSIYKFKCLSKVWRSNLSHPDFITKWFQTNKEYLEWVIYHKTDEKFKVSYPDLHSDFKSRSRFLFSFEFLINETQFQGAKLHILGSSKGLVLCCSVTPDGSRTYHVCNPVTQKWVSLPSPPRPQSREYDITGIFCECEDLLAIYKVVHIPAIHEPSENFNVDVFSSDLGVWQTFQVACGVNVLSGARNTNFVIHHGVLYWLKGGNRMLVFNLNQDNGNDVYQGSLVNLPDASGFDERIGISEGWVFYSKTKWTAGNYTMSVWVLDEGDWKIVHEGVPVDDILACLRSQIGRHQSIKVIGFSPVNCNVLLLSWMHRVWEFNIQTRVVEEFSGFNIPVGNGEYNRDMYLRVGFQPFVFKPMLTVLPPPSWMDI